MIFFSHTVAAQFRFDNKNFRTIYAEDLCRELEKNPGYVLLDVRSLGEYNDTSSSTALNIGRLEGSMNMDIRTIDKRFNQLRSFKNDPVFVYCSHSQRSRRVSKMLADSGFTNVININGGLTTLYALNPLEKACINAMLSSSNTYKILSAPELCRKLSGKFNGIFLLDVRPDSAWNGIALQERSNALGYLKGSEHIALAALKDQLGRIPKNKEIIITDLDGNDAARAARILRENGFGKVSILLEGMNRWAYFDRKDWGCKDPYVTNAKYSLISAPEFSRMLSAGQDLTVIDVRTSEEFSNNHKDAFRNIGVIRKAMSLPASELEKRMAELEHLKNQPVVLYAFSGSPEVFETAKKMADKGFTRVHVLAGGLFNLRWTAANVKGMEGLNQLVVNVPQENF